MIMMIRLFDALMWVLGFVENDDDDDRIMNLKKNAVMVLRYIVHKESCKVIQWLKPDFFQTIIQVLIRKGNIPHRPRSIKVAALHILLDACPYSKNRISMIEANVVFHLIEIGLETWEKKTTELVLGIIVHMCSSADGRAQFLSHAGGVAMVAERLLKVSPAVDHKGLKILALICKYAGTGQVLNEMINVNAVTKLCMILQADSTDFSKEKANEILRAHSNVWMNSPCIQVSNILF
ncbi:E3 ubiquitin-protein ligase PUB24-like [Impatiens glandulifera]|uniref:E3 ubiquitin-protein ligase PUB24-like n=1 Tax=Impatiens glandulifera TaxID=253017 RepID=UPI001FB0596A|nr:E3 ubiquitin-protein ligase PUB24-like [Impatiens glandulifera]